MIGLRYCSYSMLYVFPLCGFGVRFQQEGYQVPKPLIPLHGKPMLYHILDSLDVSDDDCVVCVCPEHFRLYDLDHARTTFVYLTEPTRGALDTCVKGIRRYLVDAAEHLQDAPVIFMDGDMLYDSSAQVCLNMSRALDRGSFAIAAFEDTTDATCYSFIQLDSSMDRITCIREKERISSWACCGCYGAASVRMFLQAATTTLACDSFMRRGEFYMSSVFDQMLGAGLMGRPVLLGKEHVLCCGTPAQLADALARIPPPPTPLRVCFDLDGTLVTAPEVPGDYSTVLPMQRNIQYARFLKSRGHTIILYTSRLIQTHASNVGAEVKDSGPVTFDTIERFGIPCDEIYFGKPYADFYVDDKAVPAAAQLSKYMGVYPWTSCADSITPSGGVSRKSEDIHKMECEIAYYRSIPENAQHLFPKFLGEWNGMAECMKGYEIELIMAPSASFLYSTESLTELHLERIMCGLAQLHAIRPNQPIEGTPSSFRMRLERRTAELDITLFPGIDQQMEHALSFLAEWESHPASHPTSWCMIHGDPFFTNILCTASGCKFIHMRGNFGDIVTVFGDKVYDYAKVFQSLLGYDEILHQAPVPSMYKSRLIHAFWGYIDSSLHRVVRRMTHALLLSLLPLHDMHVATKCYSLAVEMMT